MSAPRRDGDDAVLVEHPLPRTPQVWHLYPVAVLLSGEWLAPTPPPGEHGEHIRVAIR
ncbi:hypothetical protein [Streptomonospora salina]|uniref:Uncharacterized protein n=1 Tax=Streptomonospora salina TaxID=104205 RepID=A0A841E4B2_9ACTN|nr:hypothetical protein [Streptomonospora salina]MBB5997284.1 hypothetical protein [Streptomonospora salina]